MPETQDDKELASARWRFRLLLVALVVGGLGLIAVPDEVSQHLPHWPWLVWLVKHGLIELVHKLGDAMVIAAILAVGVDGYVKRTLVTEVSREAVEFAVGYAVPTKIKEHIWHILRLPCVRRNLVFRYAFSEMQPLPGYPDGYLQVTCRASYEILNLTDHPIPFDVRSSIQKPHLPGLPPNELHRLRLPTLKIDLSAHTLLSKQMCTMDGLYITATQPVKIEPGADNVLPVATERISFHRLEDSIFLDLLQPPGLGLHIDLTAPPGYAFEASFGAAGVVAKNDKPGHWTWNVPGAVLPGSHMYLAWYRVPVGAALAARAAGAVAPATEHT